MIYLNGMKIISHRYIGPIVTRIQVRYPKSKKRRIRKKWAKRHDNFKLVSEDKCLHDMFNNVILMSPENYKKLVKQLELQENGNNIPH